MGSWTGLQGNHTALSRKMTRVLALASVELGQKEGPRVAFQKQEADVRAGSQATSVPGMGREETRQPPGAPGETGQLPALLLEDLGLLFLCSWGGEVGTDPSTLYRAAGHPHATSRVRGAPRRAGPTALRLETGREASATET